MGGSLLAAAEVTGISPKSSPAQVQLNRLVGVFQAARLLSGTVAALNFF